MTAVSPNATEDLRRRRLLREGWTEECLDSERRFGSRAARLYPLLRREVMGRLVGENAVLTPLGPASLLQAFDDAPGRPGAMVLPLRPRAFIEEYRKDGTLKSRIAAAVFVSVEDVKPYVKGEV